MEIKIRHTILQALLGSISSNWIPLPELTNHIFCAQGCHGNREVSSVRANLKN